MIKLIRKIIEFLFGKNPQSKLPLYHPIESLKFDQLVFLINLERQKRSLSTLKSESRLIDIATAKAMEMNRDKSITHNGFMSRSAASEGITFAENLGYNYKSQQALLDAYMNSPSHRDNIIQANFTHVGSWTEEKYNCLVFAEYAL
jgi:uncharacterized protein YkwD